MKDYIFFILLISILGCVSSSKIQTTAKLPAIYTGMCSRETLSTNPDFKEWFNSYYSSYQVDSSAIAVIDSCGHDLSFVIFLGTWCGDSKREVPQFFKIIDKAKLNTNDITMYGVDRTKRSNDGLTDQYNIFLVPTFVVLRGEHEIGRIVESPDVSLEKDLVSILTKQ